jgi:hypothetical protein
MERKYMSPLPRRRYAQISIKVLFDRYREESRWLKAYSKKDLPFPKLPKGSTSNSQPQNSFSRNTKKLANSTPKEKGKTHLNLSRMFLCLKIARRSQLMGAKHYNRKFIPLSLTINILQTVPPIKIRINFSQCTACNIGFIRFQTFILIFIINDYNIIF